MVAPPSRQCWKSPPICWVKRDTSPAKGSLAGEQIGGSMDSILLALQSVFSPISLLANILSVVQKYTAARKH